MEITELKEIVAEAVEATKRYDNARRKLYPLVKEINDALNCFEYDIGEIEKWDVGPKTVYVLCGRSYRGEYGTEDRFFPVEWLVFKCTGENGYGKGPDWDTLRSIVEERKRKAELERKKIEDKERKAEEKRKLRAERREFERLKAKFENKK